MSAFTACRLIAPDKNPGVRPIGVAEVLRRIDIVGKATLSAIKPNILQAVGTMQLCAGQDGGCEAAVHAMRLTFADDNCQGALLVDASNAFNHLNRKVALHNIRLLAAVSITSNDPGLHNVYQNSTSQYVDGETIPSNAYKGTIQGDPLAMVFYAIATLPMIAKCNAPELFGEAWFVDDATGTRKLTHLRTWWDLLNEQGPKFGYFPNGEKTWLVVKEKDYEEATRIFATTKVQITTQGRRLLGVALGTGEFGDNVVAEKVAELQQELHTLAKKQRPSHRRHTVHWYTVCRASGYTWRELSQKVGEMLQPLESSLHQQVIPAITGREPTNEVERDLLTLYTHHREWPIPLEKFSRMRNYSISKTATPGPGADSVLVDCHVTCAASRARPQRPALLQAAAETTTSGSTGKEDLKADRRVRHYKEVGLQEWPLAGRATVPGGLYGIGLCMSLRRRTILSKSLRTGAPAPVELTIHTFRTVDRTAGHRFAVVARSGRR